MRQTNADVVLDMLSNAGVELVFTCPGTTEVPLLDAAVDRESPRFVLTTHESTAVAAADAYSRATGEIGVALLHANVGLANGLSMMEAAKVGRSRLLVLNGTKPLDNRNRRGFTQSPESTRAADPFCVQATSAASINSLPTDLLDALNRLQDAPYGPVYLEMPQDLLAAPTSQSALTPRARPTMVPSSKAISGAARLLEESKRVLLVAGSDLATGGVAELLDLSEALQAPVFEAPWRELERETVSTDHASYGGVLSYYGGTLDAATILVVGTPAFQEPDAGESLLPTTSEVIHLLDSPVDLIQDATPLVGDYAQTLSLLKNALGQVQSPERETLRAEATESYRNKIAALDHASSVPDRLSVTEFAQTLREAALDGPVVLDAVTASAAVLQLTSRGEGRELMATGSGALGWGPGAAVGVALARRNQRVSAVISDGVTLFGVQALHTAVAERADITFFVLNNQSYHAVTLALRAFGRSAAEAESYPCTDLGATDFSILATGFGIESTRVSSTQELYAAITKYRTESGPRLIEVMIDTVGAGNTAR